jgi:serine/threonine-protein kinase
MGAVYLARERALDRLVAIKVLQPESSDAESTERFRREARTAAKLTHPGIVPLHSFGEAEGMMYFVMGFVQGEPLSARLRRRGRLEPAEVREILASVAEALHYAHDRGVIHRDIKPDNILIEDETGKPVLTDFGIAKSAAGGTTFTQLGTTLGTPRYMSPEQAAGDRAVDGRSDLYSLGVVGYQLLSGRLPFEGETARELMVQHITKEPLPLKAVAPTVPDDLARAISRLLTKDPAQRPPDGRSLSQALRQSATQEEHLPQDLEELIHDLKPALWMVGGSLYVAYGCAIWGDFPEPHWQHLRTTNVVESPFAAVRLRTSAAKRFKNVANATALIWRLLIVAERRFRRLRAPKLLAAVAAGERCIDGQFVSSHRRVAA